MKRFDGKVVVITGGGSGMGKISCTLFALEGASVCVVDINEKTAKATADEIIAAGGKAKAYDCLFSEKILLAKRPEEQFHQ